MMVTMTVLSLIAIMATPSYATPGKCPEVERANVADPKKLEGDWFVPLRTPTTDDEATMKCITSKWTLDEDGKTINAHDTLIEAE